MKSPRKESAKLPFDSTYLSEWAKMNIDDEGKDVLQNILNVNMVDDDILRLTLGLRNGYAGYGLNLLLK